MRLIVRLRACKTFPYDLTYHKNLQGLIYTLIRDSAYSSLHDKQGCKHFSFSNILPPTPVVHENSKNNLIIASPNEDLLTTFMDNANQIIGKTIRIGDMHFFVEGTESFNVQVPESECVLATGTPIVIRIPRYRCSEYAITTQKDYNYVYWRKDYTPSAFVKQLEENLAKKYVEYSRMDVEPFTLFEKVRFRKQVAIPLKTKGKEGTVIGTLWDFYLQGISDAKRKVIQFGLDAGFGEMNSLGFGFINMKPSLDW